MLGLPILKTHTLTELWIAGTVYLVKFALVMIYTHLAAVLRGCWARLVTFSLWVELQGVDDFSHCAGLFCIFIVFRTYIRKCVLYGVSGSFAQLQLLSSVFVSFFFYNIIVIIIIIIIIIIIVKMNSLLKSYKNLIKTTHKTSVKYSVT